ncbi:MAG: hypothetical protein ACRDHU_11935 [Actinomycetota bacterium]
MVSLAPGDDRRKAGGRRVTDPGNGSGAILRPDTMRPLAILATLPALGLASCADPPTTSGGDPTLESLPSVARIVCEPDGGTTVETPEVLARPDGVHLIVESRLDEPASLNGLGMDVEPGRSEWTLSIGPGELDVACWPFSRHEEGGEPPTRPLGVSDPHGLHVSPELECPAGDEVGSSILDLVSPTQGSAPDAIVAAREHLDGLRPEDELRRAGYPEQEDGPVIVVREGTTVATVSVAVADDGRWLVHGASICSSAGLTG